MKVKDILSEKGPEVVTIWEDKTIIQALEVMDHRNNIRAGSAACFPLPAGKSTGGIGCRCDGAKSHHR